MHKKYLISSILFFGLSGVSFGTNIGVKNFRQLIATFHKATGLSERDPLLVQLKSKVLSRLPVNGTVEEVSATSITALYELGGGFCRRLIDVDAGRPVSERRSHKTVQFQAGPPALSVAIRDQLLDDYTQMFWQRPPSAEELSRLQDVFTEAIQGAPNNVEETKRILHVACTVVASSIDTLLY